MLIGPFLAKLGGIATRRELIEAGCYEPYIDMDADYRKVVIPRRGWYVMPNTPQAVVRAIRVGGRLACVSAIDYHEGRSSAGPLHVLVTKSASRLRTTGEPDLVLHWSRAQLAGDRAAVSRAIAERQARSCRRATEFG